MKGACNIIDNNIDTMKIKDIIFVAGSRKNIVKNTKIKIEIINPY